METKQGRMIIITGPPGTGKTTTASVIAMESDLEKSVHMHTDDFYHYLCKGAVPPIFAGGKRTEFDHYRSFSGSGKTICARWV